MPQPIFAKMLGRMTFMETPIEFLKGVGPGRADMLKKELEIFTFGDLLHHFPFRYVDRTKIWKIRDVDDAMPFIQVKGVISHLRKEGQGKAQRYAAQLNDGTGRMDLVWFQGLKWIEEYIIPGREYIVFGKPSVFRNIISITHPELTNPENEQIEVGIQPIYSITEKMRARGLDAKGMAKIIRFLLAHPSFHIDENLPTYILDRCGLVNRKEAFKHIHFPTSTDMGNAARDRLKFEELFFLQMKILRLKLGNKAIRSTIHFDKIGELFNQFYNHALPFELTNAQKRVVKEIRADLKTGRQMNRLLQGDVGSGKTVVALMGMLMAADNGYQACMMAPTEILASQHYKSISDLLFGMNVNVRILTGSTPQSERKIIAEELESGVLNILIGTHALIEDGVKFSKLGLVIIDEQHRFGVAQRYKLWTKNTEEENTSPPHILVMTATPIPRTLAMTLYGDLDVSIIDELPAGRKPIRTVHRYDRGMSELYSFIKEQIALGRQTYIVYPLIEESEKLDYQNLMQGFEEVREVFPEPEYKISMVHGRLKPREKEMAMNNFVKGDFQIMVATTVIEVGVNVPNASVMVIQSAERFGLAQLHQLRGRVGRGADQSFCILVTGDKLSADSRKRIATMVQTNDGFKIAEVDMELRGPGDIEGTRQSGLLDLKLASLTQDQKYIELTRKEAEQMLLNDAALQKPEHQLTAHFYERYMKHTGNWSRVS
jgi:ATP-dependent DNA helicase RecG